MAAGASTGDLLQPEAESVAPAEPTAVVATDEPAGFEPDPLDDIADAADPDGWGDLDLLDLDAPAAAASDAAAAAGDPTSDAPPPSLADGFGAVVNLAGGLGAVAAASTTESLAPVVEFGAVTGGAAVDTFATVTDAALLNPPVPEVPAADLPDGRGADDLAFLDFDGPANEPVDDPGDVPQGGPVELADAALPPEPPHLVETVAAPALDAEPMVDVTPPEPRLLASVSIPPPPEVPAADQMSGPSLFGFNFEGGSFLGGMPLPLKGPPTTLPPGGISFDRATARPAAPEPSPPTPAEPGQTAGEAARTRPATPLGLTGLVNGTAGAGAATSSPPRPVTPVGLMNGAPVPRLPTPPPPPLAPANGRPRSAEVFSQMAGPIGDLEAFASRPARAEQYQIPEVDRSAPPALEPAGRAEPALPGLVPPPQPRLANDERLIPADLPRRTKVRRLMVALVVLPALWVGGVYSSMSKTATVVGTLRFNGLAAQSESARRLFIGDQTSALFGDDVRTTARAMLASQGKPTGPTEDATSMSQVMGDQTIERRWGPNDLTLTYHAHDGDAGRSQLQSLMAALRSRDDFLAAKRDAAAHELDAANAALAAAKAADDDIKAQRREQTRLAESRPDKDAEDALDRTVDSANRKLEAVRAERTATESVLEGWKRQDPAKPVDPAIDPEMTTLRRQLQPILGQIAKAKQLSSSGGGSGDADDDPLSVVLKQQRDRLQAKLDRRAAELAQDRAVPPEERARQRESAIESLGTQVAGLKRSEADAAAAASTAAAAAADAHAKVDAAHVAEARAADLYTRLMDADQTLRQAGDDQADKQRAVDATVVVDGSPSTNPEVTVASQSDPRPVSAIVGGLLIAAAMFVWMLGVAGTGEDAADLATRDAGMSDDHDEAAVRDRETVGV